MTTALRKTDSHKKARAISSGFLKLINAFMLTPRQGLADKRTSFRSVVKNHEGNDTTSVDDLAYIQTQKSTSTCFGGVGGFQISNCNRSENLWLSNRWRAEE